LQVSLVKVIVVVGRLLAVFRTAFVKSACTSGTIKSSAAAGICSVISFPFLLLRGAECDVRSLMR